MSQGKVIYQGGFRDGGEFYFKTRGDILTTDCDCVVNTIGPREQPENPFVRGELAPQFARKGGPELVEFMSHPSVDNWTYGEIRDSPAYKLESGPRRPKKILHLCVPPIFEEQTSYHILRNMVERAMIRAHDMSMSSIALPMLGTGQLHYPAKEVTRAMLDAFTEFKMQNSTLKSVIVIVYEKNKEIEKEMESAEFADFFDNYKAIGITYCLTLRQPSSFSNLEMAFRESMGVDRRVYDVKVMHLSYGSLQERFNAALRRVRIRHSSMDEEDLVQHGFHGTSAKDAWSIARSGFKMKWVGKKYILGFGQGIYLSKVADIAHNYSNPGSRIPSGASRQEQLKTYITFTMLICKVIVGKACQGVQGMTKPLDGYSSALGGPGTCRNMYQIVFDEDQVLPLAVVEYKTRRRPA